MALSAITTRYLTTPEELEPIWPKLWQLVEAFNKSHAGLTGLPLRPKQEERSRAAYEESLKAGGLWLQLAEEDGAIVGFGSARILDHAVTGGHTGYFGNAYLVPSVRRRGLMQRMEQERKDLLKSLGVFAAEYGVLAANQRGMDLWGKDTWGAIWRRPVRDASLIGSSARRIRDLEQDWPLVWAALRAAGATEEDSEKQALRDTLSKRGAAFVAGDDRPGFIAGRLALNPWLFVERTGEISDLRVFQGDEDVATVLIDALEAWLVKKDAATIQTRYLPMSEAEAWTARGFEPYMYRIREEFG